MPRTGTGDCPGEDRPGAGEGSASAPRSQQLARFWEIWSLHEPYLGRLSLRWSGNRADAEDALSATKLRAAHYFPAEAASIRDSRSWLARLLYNACMDHHRQASRARRMATAVRGVAPSCAPQHPERDVVTREQWQRVQQAIASLPRPWAEALEQRCLDHRSYRELADRFGTSEANVRKRVQLAREQIRTALGR